MFIIFFISAAKIKNIFIWNTKRQNIFFSPPHTPIPRTLVLLPEDYLLFEQSFPCFYFHAQVVHGSVAFYFVAVAAKDLVVFIVIASAFGFGDDMVDFEVFHPEGFAAAVAQALLVVIEAPFHG
jgi:hypothetical protein